MKIKMLAWPSAPDYYTVSGETITAHAGEFTESYDLSEMPEGATLDSVEPIEGINPIHKAARTNGELQVTLCQKVGAGHWVESDYFDAAEYNPDAVHVIFDSSKSFSGTPVVYTRQGAMIPEVANG